MEIKPSKLASTDKISNSSNTNKKVWVKPEVEIITDDIHSGANPAFLEGTLRSRGFGPYLTLSYRS